ncbi:MAG: glycine betaine/L-proline ABC transporter substrate-binding protein ProX [Chloroflexota bacterium]
MKRLFLLIAILVFALSAAACVAPAAPAGDAADAPAEDAAGEEMALPGEGVTVTQGRPTWDTEWFQAALFSKLLEELGYEVEEPQTLDNPAFFLSAARGDVDFWASGWFPLHNTFIEDEKVAGKAVPIGMQAAGGGLQGYLMDKATAEANGITNLGDLADPEKAALFDNDGDGKADLMGCDPGWGCELVINHHLEEYGLLDTVTHVQGSYSALIADTYASIQRGESVLFYTWTPNWTVGLMIPGEDVVWIETPYYTSRDDQEFDDSDGTMSGVVGCVDDPCDLGWPPNDIQVVANVEFLEANPAAKSLFEQAQFELADIFIQNAKMYDGEDSDDDIERHAEEWIEANRELVDEWVANAIAAANQ